MAADAPLLEARGEPPASPSMGPATPGSRLAVSNPTYAATAATGQRTAINPMYATTPGGRDAATRTAVNLTYDVTPGAHDSRTTQNPSYQATPLRGGVSARDGDRDSVLSVLSVHGYEELSPGSAAGTSLVNLSGLSLGGIASPNSADASYLTIPSPSQPDEPVNLGYISISRESFSRDSVIKGVSFTPCQDNEVGAPQPHGSNNTIALTTASAESVIPTHGGSLLGNNSQLCLCIVVPHKSRPLTCKLALPLEPVYGFNHLCIHTHPRMQRNATQCLYPINTRAHLPRAVVLCRAQQRV